MTILSTSNKPRSYYRVELTTREIKVAQAMLKHFSVKLAARELGISCRSVTYCTEQFRKKMKENKTGLALLKAYQNGLI